MRRTQRTLMREMRERHAETARRTAEEARAVDDNILFDCEVCGDLTFTVVCTPCYWAARDAARLSA